MVSDVWYDNLPPKANQLVVLVVLPVGSLILFLGAAFVVPAGIGKPTNWYIVALATGMPVVFMMLSLYSDAQKPSWIRLTDTMIVWVPRIGDPHHIPKNRILRTAPLGNPKYGMAVFYFLSAKGREEWVPVTATNAERIHKWLEGQGTEAPFRYSLTQGAETRAATPPLPRLDIQPTPSGESRQSAPSSPRVTYGTFSVVGLAVGSMAVSFGAVAAWAGGPFAGLSFLPEAVAGFIMAGWALFRLHGIEGGLVQ